MVGYMLSFPLPSVPLFIIRCAAYRLRSFPPRPERRGFSEQMMTFEHVLALDIAGNPYDWIAPVEAVRLYATDKVAWYLGSTHRVFRGGYSRTGKQSIIRIRPI